MRNGRSHAAVVTPQEALPEFTKLEQALIEHLAALQNNLNNTLNEIEENDHIEIPSAARNSIRRILIDAQRSLGNIARRHAHSNKLSNFYRDVNQFVHMVDEMEMMFCETLKKCAPKKEASEEDLMLLGVAESDSLSEKSVEELFALFSGDNRNVLLADHSDMIDQIERTGDLSGDIYNASQLVDRNAQEPDFLIRFFDARRIVSEAIEKIHYVIHPRGPQRRSRSESENSDQARCYEFGLLSLCSKMKKQVNALLRKNNMAQAKRIKILKMICSLAGKVPESLSSTDSSVSGTSSESSISIINGSSDASNDSSRASSLASSGLFSRSSSPEPKNPNPSLARPRQ